MVPDNALSRVQMLQWIGTCNDYLYRDLVRALLKSDDISEANLAVAWRDLEVVDRQLQGGSFLLGNEIYLCDLFLAPMIAFAENHKAKPQLFRGL